MPVVKVLTGASLKFTTQGVYAHDEKIQRIGTYYKKSAFVIFLVD